MADTKGLFIDPELHKEIKKLAAQRGVSMREIVEELLREELQNAGTDQDQPRAPGEDRRGRG